MARFPHIGFFLPCGSALTDTKTAMPNALPTVDDIQNYAQNIVDTVREPLLILDATLRVRSANRAFYQTFHVSPAETERRLIYELGNGQWDIPDLRTLLEDIVPKSSVFDDFELEHTFPDIGRRVILLNARKLQAGQHGELLVLAMEDVTARRQAEEALVKAGALQSAIFNSANFSSIATDAKGVIQIFNVGAERMLGYTAAEVMNTITPADISDPEEVVARAKSLSVELNTPITPGFEALVFKASRGIEDIYELTYIRKDGSRFPAVVSVTALRDDQNDIIGYLLIGTDNTARKQVEAERMLLKKQMQNQAAELSDLHRRKDEFLAMLSHELRSPLAPIANAVQMLGLQRGTENLIQRQSRAIIERQMAQLQHLVDDLLEVSRITTGMVQLRRLSVTVSDIVEGAIETVRPLIEKRRHEFSVSLPSEPIWLHADAARLEQVVVNLLTNAAKYTDEAGHICLTVELVRGTALAAGCAALKTDQGLSTTPEASAIPLTGIVPGEQVAAEVVVRIRDTGVGITSELLPCIFDLFTQAERSLDRSQGGLGIGLALVQRLTKLHGGSVEVQSTLKMGSEFTVRLPIAQGEISELPVVASGQRNVRPLRVLVVDDNVDTVLSFSMLLRASGHDVQTAHDGLAAVQAAINYLPDIVLLDIGLPGLNGYEVAKQIRQHPAMNHVVLVALTGYGQDSDRHASGQAGFTHHIVKPARFEELQKILATVAEKVA